MLSVAVYNHYKRLSVNVTEDVAQTSQNVPQRPAVVITPAQPSNAPRGMVWFCLLWYNVVGFGLCGMVLCDMIQMNMIW